PLRWGQIRAHVQASQEVLGKTEQDNWLMVLPLFHVSGLSILMRSLYNGTSITILPKYDEIKVLELIESEKINMM
ncbi:O-succinylbenzoate-CoA ligase, partial [human gut metagenome]